jgi:peptidoglycan/xylan/chitin deacetylase (PgdA/CDA1 family)
MRVASSIGAAAVVAWASPALAPIMPGVARALRIPLRLDDPSATAITFDDGPHPQGTPAALAALDRAGARATFFLVGEQVERYPAIAREIAAAGHTVALHGFRHRNMLRLTPRQVRQDLMRGSDVIATATGVVPGVYRPPYGIFSSLGLRMVRRQGLTPLLWSQWAHDWRARTTAEAVAGEATRGIRGGDVILLHDADHYSAQGSWRQTAAALPRILSTLQEDGLRLRGV